MQKLSKFVLERDKRDLELYLERAERDPALFPKEVLDYKRGILKEVKKLLKEHYNL